MRECIYCGRQLEKGEQCTCAMSVAKRREKEEREKAERPKSTKEQRAEEKRRKSQARAEEKAKREQARRQTGGYRETWQRPNRGYAGGSASGNPFVNLGRLIWQFIKSPVETVMNPGRMSIAEILILVGIEGLIGGLCALSVTTGAARGVFSQLGNAMGFGGSAGYAALQWWARAAFSGIIGGYVLFFTYSGIFYLVNRFIMHQFTPYWEFVRRFTLVMLPLTLVGIVGTILGFFSLLTFIVLLICGLAAVVVLTYELLRSMWHTACPARTLYIMLLCLFVFMTFVVRLIPYV